jgi:hypothetical protein
VIDEDIENPALAVNCLDFLVAALREAAKLIGFLIVKAIKASSEKIDSDRVSGGGRIATWK